MSNKPFSFTLGTHRVLLLSRRSGQSTLFSTGQDRVAEVRKFIRSNAYLTSFRVEIKRCCQHLR